MATETTEKLIASDAIWTRKIDSIGRKLGEIEEQERALETALNEVRERFEPNIAKEHEKVKAWIAQAEAYAHENRESLFGELTELKTKLAVVKMRAKPASVSCKVTDATAIEKLESAGLGDLVKTRKSVDKAGVKKALGLGGATAKALRKIGFALSTGFSFSITPKGD